MAKGTLGKNKLNNEQEAASEQPTDAVIPVKMDSTALGLAKVGNKTLLVQVEFNAETLEVGKATVLEDGNHYDMMDSLIIEAEERYS